jgi:hypothetical protein
VARCAQNTNYRSSISRKRDRQDIGGGSNVGELARGDRADMDYEVFRVTGASLFVPEEVQATFLLVSLLGVRSLTLVLLSREQLLDGCGSPMALMQSNRCQDRRPAPPTLASEGGYLASHANGLCQDHAEPALIITYAVLISLYLSF